MGNKIVGRLWLSILALNIVNVAMILCGLKYRLSPAITNFNEEAHRVFAKRNFDAQVHDMQAEFDDDIPVSQLERVRKNNVIRVAIIEDKAYWVHDNVFYETNVVDGYIDNENAKPINAYSLSEKEFVKLLMILDNISK